jgi:hypothetical protein
VASEIAKYVIDKLSQHIVLASDRFSPHIRRRIMYIAAHHFLLPASSTAHILLDRQCWHENPLSSVYHFSSKAGVEYVSSLSNSLTLGASKHAPWSHPPICTPKLETINDILCVYTSTSFSNGRGISIFTTPSAAKEVAALPAFRNHSALEERKINIPTNTYRATSIPNKGIGLLATKPLKFKDRITAFTPVLLAYLEGELSTLDREKFWRLAITQLPKKSQDGFLELVYVFGDERVRVQDIVKANTFQIEVGGVNHLAVFPETSRLNHACNPK